MGSYNGAEICELVGLLLLNKLAHKFGGDNVGLYRDDGLLVLKGMGGRRKQLHEICKKYNIRITAEINYHTVPFTENMPFLLQKEHNSNIHTVAFARRNCRTCFQPTVNIQRRRYFPHSCVAIAQSLLHSQWCLTLG